ncbi:MAG: hypothetical protein ACRCZI_05910 [Cetobacterium sp.]
MVHINGGIIKNFRIVGEGGVYNDVTCLFKQGFWSNGKLNGASCCVTNYLNAEVNIKQGVYTNDLPNGAINEYTFNKTEWDAFLINPGAGIDATKYVRTYTAGNLSSTTSTTTQKIIGELVIINSKIQGFSFAEI